MKNLYIQFKNLVNKILYKFGYRISKINNTGELVKIYKYKDYEDYKETQIYYNKKKIDKIWADEKTLEKIIIFLEENIKSDKIKGICHGSRNGFEQNFFNEKKKILRLLVLTFLILPKITRILLSMIFMMKKKNG